MTGEVTLRCNVSDGRQWNYTWYMNGQQLNESSDVLKVPGNEETIKSEFKCQGISTVRPLYSTLSEGFIANNIIFKRKILLAISGCLVCCIVILIIGCIVLKITRKPAEAKETAPEDLFFSMTDSKNQTVSPMKEYMDNKPTELEECKEKEELITDRASPVHEDGVIKVQQIEDFDNVLSCMSITQSKKSIIIKDDSHNFYLKDEETPASEANGMKSFTGKAFQSFAPFTEKNRLTKSGLIFRNKTVTTNSGL
ncbi:titin-like isoform X1 [Labeo rohita]|uniref:Titin-like isoform X1 n=1 Tax=Labeo rohita TaxID=84645 RepID=A0A498NGA9_LABRO|nr:titin-like isoform X1 [Labeo rohita]